MFNPYTNEEKSKGNTCSPDAPTFASSTPPHTCLLDNPNHNKKHNSNSDKKDEEQACAFPYHRDPTSSTLQRKKQRWLFAEEDAEKTPSHPVSPKIALLPAEKAAAAVASQCAATPPQPLLLARASSPTHLLTSPTIVEREWATERSPSPQPQQQPLSSLSLHGLHAESESPSLWGDHAYPVQWDVDSQSGMPLPLSLLLRQYVSSSSATAAAAAAAAASSPTSPSPSPSPPPPSPEASAPLHQKSHSLPSTSLPGRASSGCTGAGRSGGGGAHGETAEMTAKAATETAQPPSRCSSTHTPAAQGVAAAVPTSPVATAPQQQKQQQQQGREEGVVVEGRRARGDGSLDQSEKETMMTTMEKEHHRWCDFLPPSWHTTKTNTLDASSTAAAAAATAMDEAVPRAHGALKPLSTNVHSQKHGAVAAKTAEKETSEQDRTFRLPHICSPPPAAAEATRPADETPSHRQRSAELTFLLTHYPQDASACLSIAYGVCSTLETMRAAPPPNPSHAMAAKEKEEAKKWRESQFMKTSPGMPAAAANGGVEEADGATCPCGCVLNGCYIDTLLYHAHKWQFSKGWKDMCNHHDKEEEKRQSMLRAAAQRGRGGGQMGDSDPIFPSVPLSLPAQCAFPQTREECERHPYAAFALRYARKIRMQHALLPLLAVQLFATFVVKCSDQVMKETAQRQQTRLRRWQALGKQPAGDHPKTKKDGEEDEPRGQGVTESVDNTSAPRTEQDSSNSSDCLATAYSTYTSQSERLWAVVACVWIAFGCVDARGARMSFVPQLASLAPASPYAAQGSANAPPRGGSSTAEATKRVLLESVLRASRADATTYSHAGQLHRLRMCVLSLPPTPHKSHHHHRSRHGKGEAEAPRAPRCPLAAATAEGGKDNGGKGSDRQKEEKEVQAPWTACQRKMNRWIKIVICMAGRCAYELPLWCTVALELVQLRAEQRQLSRRLRQQEMQTCSEAAATVDRDSETSTQPATGARNENSSEMDSEWERRCCLEVHQLVLLMSRLLLLLPAQETARLHQQQQEAEAEAFMRHGSAKVRHTKQATGMQKRHPCSSAQSPLLEQQPPQAPSTPPGEQPQQEAAATAPATATTATTPAPPLPLLLRYMQHHPLFGVAVAVVGGVVSMPVALSYLGGSSAVEEEEEEAAVVARGTEVRRLVGEIQRWLQEAERGSS